MKKFWEFECCTARNHTNVILRQLFHWNKKKVYFNTLFTKPTGSSSKGNPYNKKNVKWKKARHVARATEVLKKIAPDWSEGKICEKEDLCGDIVKELGRREQKLAVALMSSYITILLYSKTFTRQNELCDWLILGHVPLIKFKCIPTGIQFRSCCPHGALFVCFCYMIV